MTDRNTAAVDVRNLTHRIDSGQTRRRILDAVNLCVQRGESVALIGRSGSGKSTLLNLISGLEPVQHGDIRVHGRLITALGDRDRTRLRGRQIGFIYQSFNLIPTLTVSDNIILPLALAGTAAPQRRQRLADLLEATGLAGRGDDYPDRLSGGEQQRVAIARALIHQPGLILADEPTGNLDAESGRRVLTLLRDLVDEQNAALLLVTHSREVAAVANRVIVLDQAGLHRLEDRDPARSSAW